MMLVRAVAKVSRLHGTGLFAIDPIRAGTVVWEFTPGIDEAYTREEVEALPEPKRSEIFSLVHTYISNHNGKFHLNAGDAVYFNHSPDPNVIDGDDEGEECVAARDIAAGEELTIDYRKFPEENPLNFNVVD
jgi:uncharacterized protein